MTLMPIQEVLDGKRIYTVQQGDCLDLLASMPAQSVDLVFGSPPYEDVRTYGDNVKFSLSGQAWVDWMVAVVRQSLRVSRGLVAFVVEGKTRNFSWSGTPALLMADLLRGGITLRKCGAYHRRGIPGSGGPDFLKNDWEFIICATNGGRLPSWVDPVANGHPPKYPPGGAMSYRGKDGKRKAKPTLGTSGSTNGDTQTLRRYQPPEKANPGNACKCVDEIENFIECQVGRGRMGDLECHENHAPFPEKLAEWYVRPFSPENGIVLDPFSGSGTTGKVSVKWHRRYIGFDIDPAQVELSIDRIEKFTSLFHEANAPPQLPVEPEVAYEPPAIVYEQE